MIDSLAGRGGMGAVFKARDFDGTWVALKVLDAKAASQDRRFQRESKLLCSLSHPAIVRYLDSGITPAGEHFLVMEWLDGEDLRAHLRPGRLFLTETLELMSRVAQALGVAHGHGIVHRDVKPANVFLPGGDVRAAKLIDFGLARQIHATQRLTSASTLLGTPAYMSPEYIKDHREIDAASDVFSLGCILFECLTGEPAFSANDPMAVFYKILFEKGPFVRHVAPWVPEEVETLLQRMLAKDPGERLKNGSEVAEAFGELATRVADTEPRTAPRPLVKGAITEMEQRWANVVAAALGKRDDQTAKLQTPAEAPTPESLSKSVEQESASAISIHDLCVKLEAFGAKAGSLGDGTLMAVFETPEITSWRTSIDQAIHAARCALFLREELPKVPVALASGRATMGQTRLLGHVIDSAVALLGPDTRPGIRVDETSMELLGSHFEFRLDAKGTPVLLGERSMESERIVLGRPIPFVGRKRELSLLWATLNECIEEPMASAVKITGLPGYGKSRLRQEFVQQVTKTLGHVEIWMARGDPMRTGSPLGMMADLIRNFARIAEAAPARARHERLEARVAEVLPRQQTTRVSQFLGELLQIPALRPDDVQLRAARMDPMLMGDQIKRACKDLFDAVTRLRPVIVVLEDLHWGDRATVAMLESLLRDLEDRPFMVLGIARPEVHDLFPDIWSGQNPAEIPIGRLPKRAADKLVRAVLGPTVDPERIASIVDRADGNAFYLRELARSAAVGSWPLPDTVLAMVQTRLGTLDPQARQILRAASIFGIKFWRGGVLAMVSARIPLDEWLRRLVEEELISVVHTDQRFPGEKEYVFRHALIRDGAYAMLTDKDRQLGHRVAAEWLEQAEERDKQVVAEHFERGGAPERALRHYVSAAEEALRLSDLQAASALAERGVRCGAEGDLLGRLKRVEIEVHIWRQSTADITHLYAQAMELLPRGSRDWYDVVGEAALAWGRMGQIARVEELAELVRDRHERGDDALGRQIAMAKLSAQSYLSAKIELANQLLGELEAEIGDVAEADSMVAGDLHFSRALRASIALGDPASVLQELELCAERFDDIRNRRQACLHRANVGYAKAELGLYREAEADLRAVLDNAQNRAFDLAVSTALQTLGMVLARQGALDEARVLTQRAVDRFEGRDARMTSWSKIDLATIFWQSGDMDSAENQVREVLAVLPELAPLRPVALATLARVLLSRGQIKDAVTVASKAMNLLETLRAAESGESVVRLVYAEALDAAGDHERAAQAIRSAADRLMERAQSISRSDWRQSFLQNIPEHARTLELAARWSA